MVFALQVLGSENLRANGADSKRGQAVQLGRREFFFFFFCVILLSLSERWLQVLYNSVT